MENILSKIGLGPKKDLVPVVRDNDALYVYVKCDRCKEVIPVRISRKEEIQENYDKDKEKPTSIMCAKRFLVVGKTDVLPVLASTWSSTVSIGQPELKSTVEVL